VATGFEAWTPVKTQAKHIGMATGPTFPNKSRSFGTAFRRACAASDVRNLHFHRLRHEGTGRLFEVGLSIEQVAVVSGHKDWKMLRRSTLVPPEVLHRLMAVRAPFVADRQDGAVGERRFSV
jgi:integrase